MTFLELEPINLKEMGILFGPMGVIHAEIANIVLELFKEDEVWGLWLEFYNRTFMIWYARA